MIRKNFTNGKHLYSRAGFGLHYNQLESIGKLSVNELVDGLFRESAKVDFINLIEYPKPQKEYRLLLPQERRQLQRMTREQTRDLNNYFLNRLSTSNSVLREKMTLFLHGHFACRSPQNPYALQKLNNIHRK